MKRALISDIHSNLEALEAVFDDIGRQDITEIYCLGDIVGYGPNPQECLERVMELDVCILGNHDEAIMRDPVDFNMIALQAICWTRETLTSAADNSGNNPYREFLGRLPRTHHEGDYVFVHGSLLDPTDDYVFPDDIQNKRKMELLFNRIDRYCFQGHTHVPGVFTSSREYFEPSEFDYQYQLSDDKVMINVGSVGQPRDGDPRACYVVLTDDHAIFHRVEYPWETTIEKVYAIDDLDDRLGDRLRDGV